MAIEITTATLEQLSGIRQALETQIPLRDVFPEGQLVFTDSLGFQIPSARVGKIFNAKGFQNVALVQISNAVGWKLETVLNAQDLTNIANSGTTPALSLTNHNLSVSAINQLFIDLPATSKTATINVAGNPGAATCNTSIATNKGYTVVTA